MLAQQGRGAGQDLPPAATKAAGQMDVQQHDVGARRGDDGDGLFDRPGFAGDDDGRVQVRFQPGTEDGVVIHDDDPDCPS